MSQFIIGVETPTSLELIDTETYRVNRLDNGIASMTFEVLDSDSLVQTVDSPIWSFHWDYPNDFSNEGDGNYYDLPYVTKQTTLMVSVSGSIFDGENTTNILLMSLFTILPPLDLCDINLVIDESNISLRTSSTPKTRTLKTSKVTRDAKTSKSKKRSSKTKKISSTKRDLYVNDIEVPQAEEGETLVLQNLLNCNDSVFQMILMNFAEDAVYPIDVTINNRSDGTIYKYTILSAPDTGSFDVPGDFVAGTYQITLTEFNNRCQPSQIYEFIIVAPNILSVNATADTIKCYGELSMVHVVANLDRKPPMCEQYELYVRVIKDDQTIDITTGNPINTESYSSGWYVMSPENDIFVNLFAGHYNIEVIQVCESSCNFDESCGVSTSITITQPEPLNVKICCGRFHVSCNGDNDGYIDAWVKGGVGPYMYSLMKLPDTLIHDLVETSRFDELDAGQYKLIVKDHNECEIQLEFEITEPSPISVEFVQIKDNCNRVTGLRAIPSGGTPFGCCESVKCGCNNNSDVVHRSTPVPNSYLYKWYNNQNKSVIIGTNSTICGLTEGEYGVTIIDSKCCKHDSDVITIVHEPMTPKVKICKNWIDDCTYSIMVYVDCAKDPVKYYINNTLLDDDVGCYVFTKNNTFTLKVVGADGQSTTTTF